MAEMLARPHTHCGCRDGCYPLSDPYPSEPLCRKNAPTVEQPDQDVSINSDFSYYLISALLQKEHTHSKHTPNCWLGRDRD